MSIKFRMAAWSDAAGRPNNEDCFVVSKNIAAQDWAFITNETLALDEKGAVMVVCDGMGGMNAGEVASSVAIETVKEWFALEKLTDEVSKTSETILSHIKNTIIAADQKIKAEAQQDSEKEGMGSTIVLAWLIDKHIYVGWCGDSRAYRYNPFNGLERLSHDHSYVQELVDAGKLKPEMAMDHPQSNIITRSLGDIRQEAQPDTATFPLCTNDIILLCSDGLCGIMQDSEIESVIVRNTGNIGDCRDALLSASEQKGWTDNVTIALCQIVSGGDKAVQKTKVVSKKNHIGSVFLLTFVVLLLLVGAYWGGYYTAKDTIVKSGVVATDTIKVVVSSKLDSTTIENAEPKSEQAEGKADSIKKIILNRPKAVEVKTVDTKIKEEIVMPKDRLTPVNKQSVDTLNREK